MDLESVASSHDSDQLGAVVNSNVKVAVRVRPPNDREREQGYLKCVRVDPGASTICLTARPHPLPRRFVFDFVADEAATQMDVFLAVGKPITDCCLQGYNCCLLAYGQTGAGKTFTMEGPDDEGEGEAPGSSVGELRGMVPRILDYIFEQMEEERRTTAVEHTVRCSYLQIYNDHISDLLDPESTNLSIREDSKRGTYVEGIQEVLVSTPEAAAAVRKRGAAHRTVGMTAMNMESSRSHSVFTIVKESQRRDDAGVINKRVSRFFLVDLAGSERQQKSEAMGQRLREAGSINRSLSALGNVIKALVDVSEGRIRHVPYRDSKLTFLLRDALGGNSKCTLIAAVSPAEKNAEETLSTLKFVERAKLMRNAAVVNEDMLGNPAVMGEEIKRLRLEIAALRAAGGTACAIPMSPKLLPAAADNDSTGIVEEESERVRRLEHILTVSTKQALDTERKAAKEIEELQHKNAAKDSIIARLEHKAQALALIVKLRDAALGKLREVRSGMDLSTRDVSGEFQERQLEEEVATLKRMVDLHPDVIRFKMELDLTKARLKEAEDGLAAGSSGSDAEKLEAMTRLNEALREEVQEQLQGSEAARDEAQAARKEAAECRANMVAMEAHVRRIASQAEEYRVEVNSTRQQFAQLQERLRDADHVRHLRALAEARSGKLAEQLAKKEGEAANLAARLEEQGKLQAELLEELEKSAAQQERQNEKEREMGEQLREERERNQELGRIQEEMLEELEKAAGKEDAAQRLIAEQQDRIARMEADLGELRDECAEAKERAVQSEGLRAALEKEKEEAEASLRGEVGDLQAKLEQAARGMHESQVKGLKEMEEMRAAMQAQAEERVDAVAREGLEKLQALERRAGELLRELDDARAEARTAVEKANDERRDAMATIAAHEEMAQRLRSQHEEETRAFKSRIEEMARELEDKIKAGEDLEVQRQEAMALREEHEVKLQALHSRLVAMGIELQEVMRSRDCAEEHRKEALAAMKTHKDEEERLRSQLEEIGGEFEEVVRGRECAEKELQQTRAGLEEEKQALELELESRAERMQALEGLLHSAQGEVDRISKDAEGHRRSLEAAQARMAAALELSQEEAVREKEALQRQVADAARALAEMEAAAARDCAALRERVAAAEAEAATEHARAEAAEAVVRELTKKVEVEAQRAAELGAEALRAKVHLAEMEQLQNASEEKLQATEERLAQAQRERKVVDEKNDLLMKAREEADRCRQDADEKLRVESDSLERVKERLHAADGELAVLHREAEQQRAKATEAEGEREALTLLLHEHEQRAANETASLQESLDNALARVRQAEGCARVAQEEAGLARLAEKQVQEALARAEEDQERLQAEFHELEKKAWALEVVVVNMSEKACFWEHRWQGGANEAASESVSLALSGVRGGPLGTPEQHGHGGHAVENLKVRDAENVEDRESQAAHARMLLTQLAVVEAAAESRLCTALAALSAQRAAQKTGHRQLDAGGQGGRGGVGRDEPGAGDAEPGPQVCATPWRLSTVADLSLSSEHTEELELTLLDMRRARKEVMDMWCDGRMSNQMLQDSGSDSGDNVLGDVSTDSSESPGASPDWLTIPQGVLALPAPGLQSDTASPGDLLLAPRTATLSGAAQSQAALVLERAEAVLQRGIQAVEGGSEAGGAGETQGQMDKDGAPTAEEEEGERKHVGGRHLTDEEEMQAASLALLRALHGVRSVVGCMGAWVEELADQLQEENVQSQRRVEEVEEMVRLREAARKEAASLAARLVAQEGEAARQRDLLQKLEMEHAALQKRMLERELMQQQALLETAEEKEAMKERLAVAEGMKDHLVGRLVELEEENQELQRRTEATDENEMQSVEQMQVLLEGKCERDRQIAAQKQSLVMLEEQRCCLELQVQKERQRIASLHQKVEEAGKRAVVQERELRFLHKKEVEALTLELKEKADELEAATVKLREAQAELEFLGGRGQMGARENEQSSGQRAEEVREEDMHSPLLGEERRDSSAALGGQLSAGLRQATRNLWKRTKAEAVALASSMEGTPNRSALAQAAVWPGEQLLSNAEDHGPEEFGTPVTQFSSASPRSPANSFGPGSGSGSGSRLNRNRLPRIGGSGIMTRARKRMVEQWQRDTPPPPPSGEEAADEGAENEAARARAGGGEGTFHFTAGGTQPMGGETVSPREGHHAAPANKRVKGKRGALEIISVEHGSATVAGTNARESGTPAKESGKKHHTVTNKQGQEDEGDARRTQLRV